MLLVVSYFRLLQNTHIVSVGDSYIRHMHTALLMMLSGNFETGAFEDDIPKGTRLFFFHLIESMCYVLHNLGSISCVHVRYLTGL